MAITTRIEPAGNGPAQPENEQVLAANSTAPPEVDPSPQTEPPSTQALASAMAAAAAPAVVAEKKWPGWPGDSVFRLIVPVLKVGSIIGRKGEIIKKMCEETRARIRILEGAIGTADRIVLISGKEEPEAEISPAMDAVLRVFKRVNGLSEGQGDGTTSVPAGVPCSVRLLVASSQAINLIGKQGILIKSIQESTNASVRVLSEKEVPFYASPDERIVEIQGEPLKVLKALEAVVGHLRKFLVDHSVIPLFEKSYSMSGTQERAAETWVDRTQALNQTGSQAGLGIDYSHSLKRDPLYLDRETQLDSQVGLSLYGQDPAVPGLRSSGLGRTTAALVTQITQTMQIPLSYAEDIIGVGGANIGYIRRTSGAILTVQESRGLPDEITVEIKGTSSQVQAAQQLIQEFMAGHKEPAMASFGKIDSGLRSYSQLANTSYPPSSLATQSIGAYGSSGLGYSGYRL